ncbi:hypothetical protein [Cryobacterium zongtaii]|uniref:hypothetical protein n=1 Tax=Cryobacterium zongtaii TaxID=1259217 RepID=UPI0010575B59|nr:hypothetical protein [Cryobacterium zongtaii]TFC49159.1 hypothetical protein E3O57_00390 [Cryobacterium sp. TMN-39-2]
MAAIQGDTTDEHRRTGSRSPAGGSFNAPFLRRLAAARSRTIIVSPRARVRPGGGFTQIGNDPDKRDATLIDTSAGGGLITLRPKQARTWAGVGLTVVGAVPAVVLLVHPPENPFSWLGLFFLVPGLILTGYARTRSRSLTIAPDRYLEYRDLFGRRRRIEPTNTTEIIWYWDVTGSGGRPYRPLRTPIGVVDEKWAVLRNGDTTVLRLSMWVWTMTDLLTIAEAMPATLRVPEGELSPWALAKREPDYFTWLELHPLTNLMVFYIALFGVVGSVMAGLLAVIFVFGPGGGGAG